MAIHSKSSRRSRTPVSKTDPRNRVLRPKSLAAYCAVYNELCGLLICDLCKSVVPPNDFKEHVKGKTRKTVVWNAQEQDWEPESVPHNRPWPKHKGTRREYTTEEVLAPVRKELREMIGYEPTFLDRPPTKPNDKDVTFRWRKIAIPPPEEKGPIQGLKICHDGWICEIEGCDAGGGYPYCNAIQETFRKHYT